jgi:excisionase family DNA binding protein
MAEYLHLRPGGTVTPPSAQRRWLTAEEAADRSGLSVRFLRRLAKRGEVLAVRDAGDWKFEAASLDAWHPEHGLSFEAMKDIKAIAEARK